MRLFLLIVLTACLHACSKQNEEYLYVNSIDQLNGEWRWESTCGGFVGGCGYPSNSNYAVIIFCSNGKFIEKHNDTVYLQADFVLRRINDVTGTIRFNSEKYENSVSIVNNRLEIGRGELLDTYKKIR